MNALIVNLSIADLINCSVCSTLMVVAGMGYASGARDDIPVELCHTLDSFHVLGGSVQLITIGSISFERYRALYKPFDKEYTVTRIKISIFMSWMAGISCMIIAWTAFQDSPTLLLCSDVGTNISNNLSYELGIYIFVPVTFASVVFIVIFYIQILYLIQKHVKSTEKTLGKGKKKKINNKVAPSKNAKKDILVNNYIPSDFEILENVRGSRASLINIGDNNNMTTRPAGVHISPMAAYRDEVVDNKDNRVEASPTTKQDDEKQIASISIISGTVFEPVSSLKLERSAPSNDTRKVKNEMFHKKPLSKFPAAADVRPITSTVDCIKQGTQQSSGTLNPFNKTSNSSFKPIMGTNIVSTNKELVDKNTSDGMEDPQQNISLSGKNSGFNESESTVQYQNITREQRLPLLTDRLSKFVKTEAPQGSMKDTSLWQGNLLINSDSKIEGDIECTSPAGAKHSNLLSGGTEGRTNNLPNEPSGQNDEYNNQPIVVTPEEEEADDKRLESENRDSSMKRKGNKVNPERHISQSNYSDCLYSRTLATKQPIDTTKQYDNISDSRKDDTVLNDTLQVNTANDNKANDNNKVLRKDGSEKDAQSDVLRTPNEQNEECSSRKESNGSRAKTSIVKIHDADGLTVRASTTRQTVTGDICVINTSNKIKGKRKIEARSAKRTAVVLATFLIAWIPFPCIITILWVSQNSQIELMMSAYVVSMTLSLLAASVNPLLYGAINKQFSKEFKRLFKKCKQAFNRKKKH